MIEPIIICPNCSAEIKLTESLAAPLIEATRKEYEAKIAQKEQNVSRRETTLKIQLKALEEAKEAIDEQVAEKLKALERENRELRQANEILRKASAYFALAELDRRPKS